MSDKTQETTQTQEQPTTGKKSKKGTFKKICKYGGLFLAGAAVGVGGTVVTEKFIIKGKKKNA